MVFSKKWKLSTSIEGPYFALSIKWKLPMKDDKTGIRELTHEVEATVSKAGGTVGQMNAASKDLRAAGYYIKGPKK